jgi:hypothetical protein
VIAGERWLERNATERADDAGERAERAGLGEVS